MPVNVYTTEQRLREVEERLPIAFRWFTGPTLPTVGTDEVVFWEDRKEDVAKIVMRRKSRLYVFSAYPFDPGESDVTIGLEDHAHRHATGNSTKADVNTDPITPFSFTWDHKHVFKPTENLTPITIDMSSAGTELEPDAEVTPFFWFRADDIGLADGAEIAGWTEKVNGVKNLIKYGGHDGSEYVASAQNSKGGVKKSAATTVLGFLPGFGLTGDYTVFIIYKPISTVNCQIFGNDIDTGPTGSSNVGFEVPGTGAGHTLRLHYAGTTINIGNDAITVPTGFSITVIRRESNVHNCFFNGVDVTNASPVSQSGTMTPEGIFAVDADSVSPVDTEILELIGYTSALSDGTINAIFNSLNTFYALGFTVTTSTSEMFLGKDGSGVTQVTLDKDGQLGLGVAPATRLHALATTEQLRLAFDSDSYVAFTVESDSDLLISPQETGNILIDSTAIGSRLGVGIAAPLRTVHFKDSSAGSGGLILESADNNLNDATLYFHEGQTGTAQWRIGINENVSNNLYFFDDANNAFVMTLVQGGNIGIGTSVPQDGLHSTKVIRADEPVNDSNTLNQNMTIPNTNQMLMIDEFILALSSTLTIAQGGRMRVF